MRQNILFSLMVYLTSVITFTKMNSGAENRILCLVYTLFQKLLELSCGKNMGIVEKEGLENL